MKGGAEYPVAREVRVKLLQPRPFLHDRDCYREFLDEKMNSYCKSSGIDLEAIEAHLLIIRTGKCLEI